MRQGINATPAPHTIPILPTLASQSSGPKELTECDVGDDTDEAGGDMKIRRAVAVATGLAMATTFGLAGTGVATAAAPALHVHNGSQWTAEFGDQGGCEVDTFASNGTFTGHDGDAGTWSGGGKTLSMTWTMGPAKGLGFRGTFTKTPKEEYKYTINGVTSRVVQGIHSYKGQTC